MCYNYGETFYRKPTAAMKINKKELVLLIDAYADAKASRNSHLIGVMAKQLEQALDMMFEETSEPEKEISEF
jgi:hypothetical protein